MTNSKYMEISVPYDDNITLDVEIFHSDVDTYKIMEMHLSIFDGKGNYISRTKIEGDLEKVGSNTMLFDEINYSLIACYKEQLEKEQAEYIAEKEKEYRSAVGV